MNRLEVIKRSIAGLDIEPSNNFLGRRREVSRSALNELIECLSYVVFPEFITPPKQCAAGHLRYLDGPSLLQWTMAHIADILTSQLFCAFLLQGHTTGAEDGTMSLEGKTNTGKTKTTAVESTLAPQMDPIGNKNTFVSTHTTKVEKEEVLNKEYRRHSDEITEKFLTESLPCVRWLLRKDAEVVFKHDVAATSLSEVVLCYPGVSCMLYQRTAHALYKLGAPNNFTRLLTAIAHSATGIDIHPSTSIGHHFFIDHGTGIVIGATAIIGNYVSIYQGVTLGAKSFPVDKATGARLRNLPRHPIIEDGVTIYANAVVLGRITIGAGSTIGGNCWVVKSLPPKSAIAQKPSELLRAVDLMFHTDGSGI